MKSSKEISQEIILEVKRKRKKRTLIALVSSLSTLALLIFAVAFSNIVTFQSSRYLGSYLNFLSPYVSSDGDEVGLRIIDDKSAIVSVKNSAYPCSIKPVSDNDFNLTVVETESETPKNENSPSIFNVKFWDDNATVSWKIGGIKIEKVLSVTAEKNIPAGLWSLFAKQHNDGALNTNISGAGWTLILENGDSYTGEGMDSAWRSKFITIGSHLLQCFFDPVSGIIMDASVFEYDDTSFDFPDRKSVV